MLSEGVPPAMIENVGAHGRHAGRPARAQRRSRRRSGLENPAGDRGRSRPEGARSSAESPARADGGEEANATAARTRKGFYDYPEKGPKRLWPGLADLQTKKLDPDKIDVDELKHRLLGIQALETARCFEENVLTDVREADVGSILGFGFAPYSGGTLSYIDMMGSSNSSNSARKLRDEIRRPLQADTAPLDMAAKGESFYGKFAPERTGEGSVIARSIALWAGGERNPLLPGLA